MDPQALRYAANCWDRKADRLLFIESRATEAYAAMDIAINLRIRANRMEDKERTR